MIQINESTNWISQHQLALSLLCLIVVVLALSTFIAEVSFVVQKKRFFKYSKAILPISIGILIISSCLLFAVSAKGPHYSGSAEYTVKQSKTQSSGKQMIVVNDGKSDVELDVDNSETSYSRGDKVRIKITDYGSSLSKGKHHLSDTINQKHNSLLSKIINVSYDIKKID